MEMVRKIRSNFNSFEEIILFVQVFLLVTIMPFLIKALTIQRLMKVLTPGDLNSYENLNLEKSKDKIVKYTDYILNRNFWIYKSTCLKRSLVLYRLLRKSGIDVHVCFGVRYKDNLHGRETGKKLEGHAWLLYDGEIFLEKKVEETKTYKVTYCFPEIKEQVKKREPRTNYECLI
jgi:hypothetical protein